MGNEQTKHNCIPIVTVSGDRMTATLRLEPAKEGKIYDLDGLKEVLVSHGVKTGVLLDEITKMLEEEIYNRNIIVANGKVPENGKNGYFIFHVENSNAEKNKPEILEDGSVKYVTTLQHTTVDEGDLLVEYVPATRGEFGYSIDANILPPKKGQEMPSLKGKGFRMEENKTKYYAAISGKIDITDNTMNITSVLEIKESIDVGYGHIDFKGDVWIRGDIHSGMQVKATGDIVVDGHIGACLIEAGKNISVRQGIQGKQTGKVIAGGDVTCKFLEAGTITAKGNVKTKYIMNSIVVSEGSVIVEGRGAVILGGEVYAVEGIKTAHIGTEAELPTFVSVGIMSSKLERQAELVKLMEKAEEEVELLDRSSRVYDKMEKEKITKDIQDRRLKIMRAKIIKNAELREYTKERQEILNLIEKGKSAIVEATGVAYRGVQVEIRGQKMMIVETAKHVKFVLQDGEVTPVLLY